MGYSIGSGFKGFVNGNWMLFATESEYYEYIIDNLHTATENNYNTHDVI